MFFKDADGWMHLQWYIAMSLIVAGCVILWGIGAALIAVGLALVIPVTFHG